MDQSFGNNFVFSSDDFPLFSQIAFNNYFALCGLLACVGFILVIILSKQKLITSKDSIPKPCLSEENVAEQPLPFVPEGGWVGPSALDGGPAASQAALRKPKIETFWGGAVKSGTSRHDNCNLVYLNHTVKESESIKLSIHLFLSQKYLKMSSIQHSIRTGSIKNMLNPTYNMVKILKGWWSKSTQEHLKGFANLTRGIFILWFEYCILIKIVQSLLQIPDKWKTVNSISSERQENWGLKKIYSKAPKHLLSMYYEIGII